jgi:hypothetical protein
MLQYVNLKTVVFTLPTIDFLQINKHSSNDLKFIYIFIHIEYNMENHVCY